MALMLLDPPEWIDGGGYQGEGFLSYVPSRHGGPCALSFSSRVYGQQWAVFSSYEATETAAAGACRWDVGGYSNVSIHPLSAAEIDAPRYESVIGWMFDDDGPTEEPEEVRPVGVVRIVREAMRATLREIARRPEELLVMEWRDVERALFEALDGLGYGVRSTRSTKDGGYDLEVTIKGKRYLLQVKHWSEPNRVGPEAVTRFADVVLREQAAGGLFLSSSGYTRTVAAAQFKVSRAPIMLGGKRKMVSFCRSFVLSEGGIWERDGSLTEVFFGETI